MKFISEIVDSNFDEVVKRWPEAKEKAEEQKRQMLKDLDSFKKEDAILGREDTLEDLEKGIAYTKKQIKEFSHKPKGIFYQTKLAEYKAMFAFYQHLKTTIFTDKPTKAPKPSPYTLGPELVEVVKAALEAKELLTPGGQYIGNKKQVKALYNVLVKRGYVLGIQAPEESFAVWFLENIANGIKEKGITARALRNPASQGQKEEEIDFKSLIPDKK